VSAPYPTPDQNSVMTNRCN